MTLKRECSIVSMFFFLGITVLLTIGGNSQDYARQKTIFGRQSSPTKVLPQIPLDIPVYSVSLFDPPEERYNMIIQQKRHLLNEFIDYLYEIPNFKYSMYLAKFFFTILPESFIRNYLGPEFYDSCKGIAFQSHRQIQQIIVYNYMYEIGAAKDFCTSIAVTQRQSINSSQSFNLTTSDQKQNLTLLARNLDYGFQKYLAQNTIKIDFFADYNSDKQLYSVITHAGFVSSHTVVKRETQNNIQFGLTLNQRKSQDILSTLGNIIFNQCESVFQLTNRLLVTDIPSIQKFIEIVSSSKSCSKFYFIVQTKSGDHAVIEKDEGVGAHQVYLNKANQAKEKTFFVLQTNTDRENPDPDGRRDIAIGKMNKVIETKGQIKKGEVKDILLQGPNFNELTLMTALIDVEQGKIDAVVWDSEVSQKKFRNKK